MDPNQTLADLRIAISRGDLDRAIELFDALDGWLTGGGFLPAEWVVRQPQRRRP